MYKAIRTSIKAKLILIIAVALFFSGIGISATVIYSQYKSQLDQMKRDGLAIARITAKNIETTAKNNGYT